MTTMMGIIEEECKNILLQVTCKISCIVTSSARGGGGGEREIGLD